jgi:GntR family transcriptional regulator/MocR family aminotransferase
MSDPEWLLASLRSRRQAGRISKRELAETLRALIAGGTLVPGTRLPSTRSIARHAGVRRNAVVDVFESLCSYGLVVGKRGSGTFVAGS